MILCGKLETRTLTSLPGRPGLWKVVILFCPLQVNPISGLSQDLAQFRAWTSPEFEA